MVDDWQEDMSQPNPFEEMALETTQGDVERELLADEQAERARASAEAKPVHDTTASKFLSIGLDLENQQHALLAKAKQLKRGQGLYEEGAMERRRATLCDRIETWRSIQTLYMPGMTQMRQINSTRTDAMPTEKDTEMPEAIPLWLPSSLPSGLRESGCVDGLVEKERRLQLAEADDALVSLRQQLRITTGVFNYKKTHVSGTGQKSNTCAWTLLSQLTAKTKLFADRYRAARKALGTLDPDRDWQRRLLPLRPEDIRGPTRQDDESEGRRELTWIWLAGRVAQVPVNDGDEFEIAEGMQVEWAKTHARANRWQEEVILLTEEMRRVVVYLDWKALWWRAQDGLRAYAHRQADLMHRLAKSFAALWYPVLTAEGITIEWPEYYMTYAQDHPPKVRTLRRTAPLKTAHEGEDSGSDGLDDEDDEDEGSGYSSPDGDDADVSPYK
ncbi:hypothetical protein PILCRDRAFT_15830 [Piloderma croceum F 1598]|uniref:Uncharacterized protein n=1 Tax=Piloderma croceum (strain F 1598) TaxID=765440 RepID=A0A0C3EXT3_PILCF|nr:hypothetical protein PILCRDRAFT_15830 [Piloderma croceum F 1598]